jgi:beta-N-acetylhexosaminidase
MPQSSSKAIAAERSLPALSISLVTAVPGGFASRVVDVTKFWSDQELLPYRYLLDKGLGDMVMTAHTFNTSLDPDYPATLSQKTVDGILRQRLGFDGVVVSDDLYMGAIVQHYSYETAVEKALDAGVDLLVVANDKLYNPEVAPRTIALIKQLVDRGRIIASALIRPVAAS